MDKKLNNTSKNTGFPDQRVSSNTKAKKDWYMACTNYIIDRAISEDNKDEVINNINAANGIVDNSTIQYALKAYGKKLPVNSRFPTTIRNIDIITPIKERYMGEYIKQYHNYQVYIQDSDALFQRNEEMYKAISTKLMKEFEKLLQGEQEDLKDLDIEKFAEEFINDWQDERAIRGQERLNLINELTDSIILYIEGFFYWWATEQVFSYRTISNNELVKEIVPPWEYYRIDSGNVFVEDDDMGMRKYKMSLNQIIDEFRDELTESDIEYLQTLVVKSTGDLDEASTNLIYDRAVNHNEFNASLAKKDVIANYSPNDYSGHIYVYHSVWKTQTKIYKLTYRDFETGEEQVIEVPEDYKMNEAAGDISREIDWINEAYESYRLGGKFEGIYLKARPVEVQRQEINNTSICKLPYNGITYMIKGNKSNPIPKRLIVYQELLKLYHYQREKAISKFKAFNLMPESILQDSKNMDLTERLNYAQIDDILPYNDYDIDPTVLNGIKNLYNQGAERYIQILSEVIASLKDEAMETANMNQQRYGDIQQRAGKSTTEYAITKATTGSILLFEMFNKFRERDYMADIDYSKAAWVDGKRGSFMDPDTNNIVYVDIDGVDELGTNTGVFIRNSTLEEEKLQQYKELAFSAAQNGELSIAAEAIDANNSSKLKQLIKDAEEERKQFEQAERKSREAVEKAITDRDIQLEQVKGDIDKALEQFKQMNENKRAALDADVKLEEIEQKFASQDSGDVTDEFKQQMERAKQRLAEKKYELDRYKAKQQAQNRKEKPVTK